MRASGCPNPKYGGVGLMAYRVLVDDNFHYMEEDERTTYGEFETLEAAIEACKNIVDQWLQSAYSPGMTAESLSSSYVNFGEDPFIVGPGVSGVPFSAWTYAAQRAVEMCR